MIDEQWRDQVAPGAAPERTWLERELVRARADAEELLSLVSHDLKNPLAAIAAGAALIVRQAPAGGDGEALRRIARTIQHSATRMNRLIQDLLDAGRFAAGQLRVEARRQPLAPLVADALEQLAPLAAQRQIKLTRELPDGIEVSCDRELLQRVLENLLGNAIKFTPEGGRVAIACARAGGGQSVRLSVSDTGCGIAPAELPHIFERYWQAHAAERRGTGLGLAIAKAIVEAHGGRIWAESAVGEGTTLSFTLPAG